MGIVTRYFSTSGAGAADGTSWANRAPLLSSGAFNSIITGFNFTAATDSLRCLVGPGTYSLTSTLATGSFSSGQPTAACPLIVEACDSSGALLAVPDPDWCSAMPVWDSTNLPVIATTTNIGTAQIAMAKWRNIKFTASGRTGGAMFTSGYYEWCIFENSTSNTGTSIYTIAIRFALRNCAFKQTGISYGSVLTPNVSVCEIHNCRIEGPGKSSGGSGNRYGVLWQDTGYMSKCTVFGHPGHGIINNYLNTASQVAVADSVVLDNGMSGIHHSSTVSQTQISDHSRCFIAGNSTNGVNASSATRVFVNKCRFRDNTSGDMSGFGNYPTDSENDTSAGSNSDEFKDYAAGDFRIKKTSTLWGQGYGAGDEPAAAGGERVSLFC